jgi:hypothetical protein
LALLSAAGDRMNPIVVKEFRQAVQSRLVVTVLVLSLLINLSIMGGYLLLTPNVDTSLDGGQTVFMFLLSLLQITCLGFVPLYAGIRLSLERNDTNIDLFFVTTITPGAIIRGKYLTATALTLLIYSACMPFITFTYLLRGIDLLTIFYVLGTSFLVCAAANAAGIFAGCMPLSWFMRGIVGVAMVIGLLITTVSSLEMTGALVMFGMGQPMRGWSFWAGVGSFVLVEVLGIGLLLVLSVALLSPKPSNRMLVPRLYIMAWWAIAGAVAVLWSYCEGSVTPMYPWVVISGIGLMILTAVALGERDTWSTRVRKKIPRNPLLRRFAFLLYTGSAGGIVWCTLLFAVTMFVAYSVGGWSRLTVAIGYLDTCNNTAIVFGYVLCYCLTIAALRPTLLKNIPTTNLPVIAAMFALIVWCVPVFVDFMISTGWEDTMPWYLLASPVVLTAKATATARHVAGPVVLGWLMLAVLASAPWFFGQWRRFVPYQTAQRQPEPAAAVAAGISLEE